MAGIWVLMPALLAQSGLAQNRVEGPALGVVWDEGHNAARLLRGIPGASVQGDGLEAPVKARAGDSAGETSAVVGEDGNLYLWNIRAGANWKRIALPEGALGIRLGESGESAVVLYPEAQARILTGLSAEPRVGPALALENNGETLALSADGSLLLEAAGQALWVTNASGNRWKLEFDAPVNDVALVASGDAAVAANDGVWLVRDVAGNAAKTLLASRAAKRVAALRQGRTILALGEEGTQLDAIDSISGEARVVELPVAAQALKRIGTGDVFRLTSEGNGAVIWMLDCSRAEPRTFFIPAAQARSSENTTE